MPRSNLGKLSPWIESVILSYSGQEEGGGGVGAGRLKAHVIGVGQMNQSQAQGSDGPTGLLFLSDGELQIPAILTASAWEHLQEQEDRECFTSLVNTTVYIQDYQLQFHMALEQTKCRFVLSVGELAMTAAGPVKDNTPCSTTLPSVRLKICQTWRTLLDQETSHDSQRSQCGFELSELLGEWRHDCLQAVLDDIRQRLMAANPQPSTSACNSSSTHPETLTATGWEVDRVMYKGGERFTVPIKCLLIPEEDVQLVQTPLSVRSRTTGGLPAASEDRTGPSGTTRPSADEAECRTAAVEQDEDAIEISPCPVEDSVLHEDTMDSPLSNPWDIFPPPCDTSSSCDASPEATPTRLLHSPASAELVSDHCVTSTSTQLPVHGSTSEHSKGELSLPPYQKVPNSTSIINAPSPPACPPEPFTGLSNPSPPTYRRHTNTTQQHLPTLDLLEKDLEENVGRESRKRKSSEPTPGGLNASVEEEALVSGSPPSWLFDTQAGSRPEEGRVHKQGQTAGPVPRKRAGIHADGRCFSYSYQASGQNLQDFTRFKVAESLLSWAVKYLVVPQQTDSSLTDLSVTDLAGSKCCS